MTDKELLYIEDCLNAEDILKKKCDEYASKVTDPDLKTMIQNLATFHQTSFQKVYKELES